MEIVVAVKPVPEAETRLRVAADGRRLDEEAVKFVLGGYDESAVEQALLLKEAIPNSTVRAVSYGVPGRTEEVLRAALALGCDRATWVEAAPGVEADPASVARAVAMGVRKGPAELVICGKQAGDDEAGMVAAALGEELGWPDLGYAVDVRWDASRKVVTLQRASETGMEAWEAPLPLVIGLQQAWNDPRTAKLPNILKSRRMPIEKIPASEVAPALAGRTGRSTAERFELPPPRKGARMIEFKTPEEAAEKLVKALREEAKVFP